MRVDFPSNKSNISYIPSPGPRLWSWTRHDSDKRPVYSVARTQILIWPIVNIILCFQQKLFSCTDSTIELNRRNWLCLWIGPCGRKGNWKPLQRMIAAAIWLTWFAFFLYSITEYVLNFIQILKAVTPLLEKLCMCTKYANEGIGLHWILLRRVLFVNRWKKPSEDCDLGQSWVLVMEA